MFEKNKSAFELLVINKFGKIVADKIDWSMPRVICIANNFNQYDIDAVHAVREMRCCFSLIRYKKFNDLLLFEHINPNQKQMNKTTMQTQQVNSRLVVINKENNYVFMERYKKSLDDIKFIFDTLKDYVVSLSDDVVEVPLKHYTVFRRNINNFASITLRQKKILMHYKLNPANYQLTNKLRDVTDRGHLGYGYLQLIVQNKEDIAFAKELLAKAYNEN